MRMDCLPLRAPQEETAAILPVPSVGGLDETVVATEAVADDEVTVEVFGIGKARERGELFDIACVGPAVEDFDAVPLSGLLRECREDGFFDGVEAVVT